LSGEKDISSCEIEFNSGCFVNILDNDTVILPQGDYASVGQYAVSGDKISCNFDKPWPIRELFTLKGIMQAAPSNPYIIGSGQISFVMRAKIAGDTQTIKKMFTIRRVGKRSFEEIMSNGANRAEYDGMKGYLVYCSEYIHGYFISDSGNFRHVIPWCGNEQASTIEYTNAVTASWGWNMATAKKISNTVISKYPLKYNVLVKPGYCALYSGSFDKYYESTSLGVLREITKGKADSHGAGKTIGIWDCFLTNYTIDNSTDLKTGMKQNGLLLKSIRPSSYFDLLGRNISANSARRSAAGISIVNFSNGKAISSLNFHRLR